MKFWLPVLALGLLAAVPQVAAADPARVVGDVAMRAGPGTAYPVLLTIVKGSTLNTRRCRNGWCQVTVEGRRGYVNARRLDFAAYVPPRRSAPVQRRQERSVDRKTADEERTSSVSRGARQFVPLPEAAPSGRLPAAEMPHGPLAPPPVVDAPPTVPSTEPKPMPIMPSRTPDPPTFKVPEGVPEISL